MVVCKARAGGIVRQSGAVICSVTCILWSLSIPRMRIGRGMSSCRCSAIRVRRSLAVETDSADALHLLRYQLGRIQPACSHGDASASLCRLLFPTTGKGSFFAKAAQGDADAENDGADSDASEPAGAPPSQTMFNSQVLRKQQGANHHHQSEKRADQSTKEARKSIAVGGALTLRLAWSNRLFPGWLLRWNGR